MARTSIDHKQSISQGDQLLTSALRCALYGDGGNRIEQMASELIDLALNGAGDVPHHVRLAAIKAIYDRLDGRTAQLNRSEHQSNFDQQGGHLPRVIFDPPVQLHLPLLQ
jgi:hypothetical protein